MKSGTSIAKLDVFFDRIQKDIVLHGKPAVTIANAMKQNQSDRLSVVVVHRGMGTAHRVWGEMRAIEGIRTTKTTIYQAASTTKLITGLGFAGAHRRGDLKLNRSVARFCQLFPDSLVARWANVKFNRNEKEYLEEITLKRLLTHTAGLDTHGIGTTNVDRREEAIELTLLGHIHDPVYGGVNPIGRPGEFYSYSGGGYTVAESMLETETRTSFSTYMAQHVLQPFGMRRSTFGTASSMLFNLAWGCNQNKCQEPELTRVKAAGGLLAHPEDLAELVLLVGIGGRDRDGKQVIPEEDVEAVLTPPFIARARIGRGHMEAALRSPGHSPRGSQLYRSPRSTSRVGVSSRLTRTGGGTGWGPSCGKALAATDTRASWCMVVPRTDSRPDSSTTATGRLVSW